MIEVMESRFWERVEKGEAGDCWLWKGHRDTKGYGILIVGGKKTRATRVSLELHGQPRPDGLFALHICDNPPCVNPHHLRWGNHSDNGIDAVERGQHPKTAQTHCKHGHALSGNNLKVRFDGYRACRKCLVRTQTEYLERKRAKEGSNV